jgi:hypothetical protein
MIETIKKHIFKSNIPHLQTNPGIGDLINCYIYGSELFNRFESVKIRIDYGVLYFYRNDNKYSESLHKFTQSLAKCVFKDPRFQLIDDPLDTGSICTHDYSKLLDVEFKPKDLSFIVHKEDFEKPNYNYVVINVKIREYDKTLNDSNIQYLIKYLNCYNGKIILMGDRIVDYNKNTEYNSYKHWVYSIYYQLIDKLDKDKVIDLTQEHLMHEPNIDKFVYEYNLVKNANEVIQIGFSGSYLISLGLNKNVKVICHNNNFIWMAKLYLPEQNILKTYKELLT